MSERYWNNPPEWISPAQNVFGSLCGLCDSATAHTHSQVRCRVCRQHGLWENWPFCTCKLPGWKEPSEIERGAFLRGLSDYALLSFYREEIRNLTLAQWKMELERQGPLHDEANRIEQEVLRRLWKPQTHERV